MLLSLRKNGLTSLFKEVRVFKGLGFATSDRFPERGGNVGGPCVYLIQCPKGPNLEKFQDRLKFSISLENFNLA